MKYVASITHTYLSQYIAVSLYLSEEEDSFILTLWKYKEAPDQLQALNNIASNNNNNYS